MDMPIVCRLESGHWKKSVKSIIYPVFLVFIVFLVYPVIECFWRISKEHTITRRYDRILLLHHHHFFSIHHEKKLDYNVIVIFIFSTNAIA